MTNVERRDPRGTYHMMSVAELTTLAPRFGWDAYFKARGIEHLDRFNVAQPKFFTAVSAMLDSVPLESWKTYLRWHVLDDSESRLSSEWVNEDFRFSQALFGVKERIPRWKRCVRATDEALGEALGAEYVKKTFTPEAKAHALVMVKNLEASLHQRLLVLDWMGDSTKIQASAKLDAFVNKIGYPDHWRDYSTLEVRRGPFVANADRAAEFESRWTGANGA